MHKLKQIALLLMIMTAASCAYISYLRCTTVPSGLIRLHVIANSNSFYDQQLKYRIKDRIVLETRDDFSKAKNIEEARKIADSSARTIAMAAADEIKRQGYNYPVKVARGTFQFPAKTYTIRKESGQISQLTLPPGKYEAVRVIIGDGKGANWWCVLYPPLCFVDLAKSAPTASIAAASAAEKQIQGQYYGSKPRVEYRIKAIELFRSLINKE
ncbi:stage II sporulation protein R [Desulfotruncus alcoholivorax]|uniref:stage II sporulation protein R n=1 Tax=Desulfotruncus alcoholivorax TaxID=265477 RepID=UPI0003FAE9CC|nr:stage II sporulation protein R [Desulfotruncus alcoholivorax]